MKKLIIVLTLIWQAGLAQNDECLSTFTGHGKLIHAVAYSPDRKTIVSASEDQTIKLWDATTGHCLKTFKGHKNAVFSIAYNQTGNLIASGCYDGTIKIWNLDNGKCIKTLEGHTGGVRALFFDEFSPSEYLFSASIDGTIKKWNIDKGVCLNTLKGHTGAIMSMSYSHFKIITGSADKTVKIWDYHSGECINTLKGHKEQVTSVALSSDAKIAVSGSSDKSIRLWNVDNGDSIKIFKGHEGFVLSVDINNDKTSIVSSSSDNSIKLWYLNVDTAIKTFTGHKNWVWDVDFSKDGFRVVSAGMDSTIKQWNVSAYTTNAFNIKKFESPKFVDNSLVKGDFFTTDDGYKAVKIGNQIWMAENLDVDHYQNGDPILEVQDAKAWADTNNKSGAWCYYNNDIDYGAKFGKLYNWYAVSDPRGLTPKGWHIPTQKEWQELLYMVGPYNAPKITSSIYDNSIGNTSGLSAVYSHCRKENGDFDGWLDAGFYCSTIIDKSNSKAFILNGSIDTDDRSVPNKAGLSIRCVKD